jgi:hypothetical protein
MACSAPLRVGQGDSGDTLARGDAQQGAVRACDAPTRWSARHENGVGERDRATGAVIVSSTNFTCAPGLSEFEREQRQALCQKTLDQRSCSLDLEVIAPLESVYRLSEIEGGHCCSAPQHLLHLTGCGLSPKQRDQRRSVDQRARRGLSRVSGARALGHPVPLPDPSAWPPRSRARRSASRTLLQRPPPDRLEPGAAPRGRHDLRQGQRGYASACAPPREPIPDLRWI